MQMLSWVLNVMKQKPWDLPWDKTTDTSDVTFPKLEAEQTKRGIL